MGQSTNAQLTYGVLLTEENCGQYEGERPKFFDAALKDMSEDDLDKMEMSDFIWWETGDGRRWREDMPERERRDFWSAVTQAEARYPVALEKHCHCDYPMYIVRPNLSALNETALRGYPVSFEGLPGVSGGHTQNLIDWCKQHGIADPEPQWHLTSWWC